MKKVRVLHVIPWFIGYGIERFIVDFMAGIDKEKFEVGLIIVGSYEASALKDQLDHTDIRIFHLDLPVNPDILTKKMGIDDYTNSWKILLHERRSILAVRKVFRQFKPDIVHTHFLGIIPAFLPAVLRPGLIRVHTVHTEGNMEKTNLGPVGCYALEKQKFLPVFISEFACASLKEMLNIKSAKVIKNGINTEKFRLSPEPHNGDTVTIINVSRFTEEKRHALMIRAFSKVCRECDNVRLVLVGEGELQKATEDLVKVCKITDKVDFLGRRGDVPELLAKSDIYVMTTRKEGFGLSTVEGMACGLPVAAMNSGSAPELVTDGVNGFLTGDKKPTELAEALIKLVKDKALREQMGKKSREFAVGLDIKNMVKNYENYYMELYRQKKKQRFK